MKALILLSLMLATPALAAATPRDPAIAAQITSRALQDQRAYELVTSLTTQVGARLGGSEGEARARQWALRRLRELGFENVREERFAMSAWRRGTAHASIMAPFSQELAIVALGRSPATPTQGITAPVAYFADLDALRAAAVGSLQGKIAFVDGVRMARSRLGEAYAPDAARRRHAALEAARRGALAVLIRSEGSSESRLAHTGVMAVDDDVPAIPAAALAHPDADQLARLVGLGQPITLRLVMTPTTYPSESGNVIAELRGSELPEEYVLLGAHLDSWDLGTGAVDDGAGVAIVMAAARLLMDMPQRPRRTIRVVLFGDEEMNLSGARDYAERHRSDHHVIAAESDYGAGPIWGFYTGVPQSLLPQMDNIAAALKPLGIERGHNRASGGEDLTFLRARGVPVVSLVQDATHYFDYHHSADDTLDKIDPGALRQNVAAFALFAWLAAGM